MPRVTRERQVQPPIGRPQPGKSLPLPSTPSKTTTTLPKITEVTPASSSTVEAVARALLASDFECVLSHRRTLNAKRLFESTYHCGGGLYIEPAKVLLEILLHLSDFKSDRYVPVNVTHFLEFQGSGALSLFNPGPFNDLDFLLTTLFEINVSDLKGTSVGWETLKIMNHYFPAVKKVVNEAIIRLYAPHLTAQQLEAKHRTDGKRLQAPIASIDAPKANRFAFIQYDIFGFKWAPKFRFIDNLSGKVTIVEPFKDSCAAIRDDIRISIEQAIKTGNYSNMIARSTHYPIEVTLKELKRGRLHTDNPSWDKFLRFMSKMSLENLEVDRNEMRILFDLFAKEKGIKTLDVIAEYLKGREVHESCFWLLNLYVICPEHQSTIARMLADRLHPKLAESDLEHFMDTLFEIVNPNQKEGQVRLPIGEKIYLIYTQRRNLTPDIPSFASRIASELKLLSPVRYEKQEITEHEEVSDDASSVPSIESETPSLTQWLERFSWLRRSYSFFEMQKAIDELDISEVQVALKNHTKDEQLVFLLNLRLLCKKPWAKEKVEALIAEYFPDKPLAHLKIASLGRISGYEGCTADQLEKKVAAITSVDEVPIHDRRVGTIAGKLRLFFPSGDEIRSLYPLFNEDSPLPKADIDAAARTILFHYPLSEKRSFAIHLLFLNPTLFKKLDCEQFLKRTKEESKEDLLLPHSKADIEMMDALQLQEWIKCARKAHDPKVDELLAYAYLRQMDFGEDPLLLCGKIIALIPEVLRINPTWDICETLTNLFPLSFIRHHLDRDQFHTRVIQNLLAMHDSFALHLAYILWKETNENPNLILPLLQGIGSEPIIFDELYSRKPKLELDTHLEILLKALPYNETYISTVKSLIDKRENQPKLKSLQPLLESFIALSVSDATRRQLLLILSPWIDNKALLIDAYKALLEKAKEESLSLLGEALKIGDAKALQESIERFFKTISFETLLALIKKSHPLLEPFICQKIQEDFDPSWNLLLAWETATTSSKLALQKALFIQASNDNTSLRELTRLVVKKPPPMQETFVKVIEKTLQKSEETIPIDAEFESCPWLTLSCELIAILEDKSVKEKFQDQLLRICSKNPVVIDLLLHYFLPTLDNLSQACIYEVVKKLCNDFIREFAKPAFSLPSPISPLTHHAASAAFKLHTLLKEHSLDMHQKLLPWILYNTQLAELYLKQYPNEDPALITYYTTALNAILEQKSGELIAIATRLCFFDSCKEFRDKVIELWAEVDNPVAASSFSPFLCATNAKTLTQGCLKHGDCPSFIFQTQVLPPQLFIECAQLVFSSKGPLKPSTAQIFGRCLELGFYDVPNAQLMWGNLYERSSGLSRDELFNIFADNSAFWDVRTSPTLSSELIVELLQRFLSKDYYLPFPYQCIANLWPTYCKESKFFEKEEQREQSRQIWISLAQYQAPDEYFWINLLQYTPPEPSERSIGYCEAMIRVIGKACGHLALGDALKDDLPMHWLLKAKDRFSSLLTNQKAIFGIGNKFPVEVISYLHALIRSSHAHVDHFDLALKTLQIFDAVLEEKDLSLAALQQIIDAARMTFPVRGRILPKQKMELLANFIDLFCQSKLTPLCLEQLGNQILLPYFMLAIAMGDHENSKRAVEITLLLPSKIRQYLLLHYDEVTCLFSREFNEINTLISKHIQGKPSLKVVPARCFYDIIDLSVVDLQERASLFLLYRALIEALNVQRPSDREGCVKLNEGMRSTIQIFKEQCKALKTLPQSFLNPSIALNEQLKASRDDFELMMNFCWLFYQDMTGIVSPAMARSSLLEDMQTKTQEKTDWRLTSLRAIELWSSNFTAHASERRVPTWMIQARNIQQRLNYQLELDK